MRISNPFRMNDWNLTKFLCTILAIQAATLLVLGVDSSSPELLLLRQIICFTYLTFIPGLVVLRALKLHGLGAVETIAYTVGLSLASVMFVGAFLNMFLPLAGISQPIALLPLVISLTVWVLGFCMISYLRDRDYRGEAFLELNAGLLPPALLLLLVPFLAIFGTYLMNLTDSNTLLVILIWVLCAIVLLVGFSKIIPKELYPLAVFIVALSLLFHNSLISSSLIGWDIHQEKYLADYVIAGGYWNVGLDHLINSMLSIMILAPTYAIFLNTDVIWIYKVVFPLLFALLPVILFQVYRKQSDDKVAFLSTFVFTSLVVYYTEMLQVARQEIAELFMGLLLLLLVDRSMDKRNWTMLFMLFAVSLVLSHYGLTYLFIGMIILTWALTFLASKVGKTGLSDLNRKLSPIVILVLVVFCAIWYTSTAAADPFNTIVMVGSRIVNPFVQVAIAYFTPIAAPAAHLNATAANVTGATTSGAMTQPMTLITSAKESAMHNNYLYILLASQVLIVLGVLSVPLFKGRYRFTREYYTMGLVNTLILAVALVLPWFASSLNTTRLYQITLIVLAPFVVAGWLNIFRLPELATRRPSRGLLAAGIALLSVFLAVYLIFNTGLAFEIFKDVPMSYSLNDKNQNLSYTIYNNMEIAGAEWTIGSRDNVTRANNGTFVTPIFSDTNHMLLLLDWNPQRSYGIPDVAAQIPTSVYIYLGTYNIMNDKAVRVSWDGEMQNVYKINISSIGTSRNRIYANGGSAVYL